MGLWKEIRKEGSRLSNYIVFSVGNGRRVRFGRILGVVMRLFATLFPLCMLWRFQKRSEWQRFGTLWVGGSWSPCFSRVFND